jgi:single-strand DNA-binding protein
MASGVNKVILIGNLGRDPEIQTFENGVKKAAFSLATTETYKGKDGNKTSQTEWHNIVLWRGLAEIAETYLKKGHQIFLEGKIRTRSWEDKDGNKRFTTEIVGDNMTMLGSPTKTHNVMDEAPSVNEPETHFATDQPATEDDLPF